jgi:peptide deformylase
MFETMYAAPGSGLAANQVGVPLRLCVIDVRPDDKRQPVVLINPRIVHRKEKVTVQEGCLSIPGLLVEMKRFRQVRVEALNERGFPVVINGEDFFAQALQHEIDHLDGKIYVDYLSPSRKKALEQEIEKRRKRGEL